MTSLNIDLNLSFVPSADNLADFPSRRLSLQDARLPHVRALAGGAGTLWPLRWPLSPMFRRIWMVKICRSSHPTPPRGVQELMFLRKFLAPRHAICFPILTSSLHSASSLTCSSICDHFPPPLRLLYPMSPHEDIGGRLCVQLHHPECSWRIYKGSKEALPSKHGYSSSWPIPWDLWVFRSLNKD